MRRVALVLAVAGLAAVLLLAPWPGSPGAHGSGIRQDVRVVLAWKPQAEFAGYYVAQEKGFYAAHGLNVYVVPGGPDVDPIRYMRSGRAEFATSLLSGALVAQRKGTPLVDVCQLMNRSSLMIVAWRKAVKRRQDLDGARMSMWGPSTSASFFAYFSAAHVHPRLVPQYYTVNLFLRGGVDACAAMEYNEYHTILDSGVDPDELTTFYMRDAGVGFPEDGIYTLAATQRTRPALCRSFVAATLEGWEYCREHPEDAVDIVMRQTLAAHVPTNAVHQRWMLDHVLAAIFPGAHDTWQVGKLSRVDYRRACAIMTGEGLIAGAPSYARFVAPEARGVP